ncbi:MAG: hypothetical protein ABI824_15505, partial [Acidobacteriota bacterium]
MFKKLTILTSLLLAGGAILWGADFWGTKPVAEWSDKEVQGLITKSPWADKVDVDGGIPNAPASTVRLIWRTALPMKQALAKRNGTLDTPATNAAFARQEQSYILQLVGMPGST